MANAFLNETRYISNAMLLLLKNELVYGKLVNTKFGGQTNDENGLTIKVKRPPRFRRNDDSALSAALAAQDLVTGSVSLTVNRYAKAHFSVGDIEYVQSFNDLMRNQSMKSAASTLAHQIDSYIGGLTKQFFGYVGTGTFSTDPDNNIGTPAEFAPVHTRLMEQGCPNSDLVGAITFADAQEITGSLVTGNIDGVNRSALEEARVPMLSKIRTYATQQCPVIALGTRVAGATSLIDNGTLSVNYRDVKDTMYQTIHIDGQASGVTIKVGEIFTIADVYAWDWRNGVRLSYLQPFTVLGAGVSGGAAAVGQDGITTTNGDIDIIVSPPLIVQGTSDGVSTDANTAFATVNAAAVDGAAVTHLGVASASQRVRAAWNMGAITLATAQLVTPFTGQASFSRDENTGISVRYWRASDASTGAHLHRFDCMYGAIVTDPYLGARVSGT